MGKRYVSNYDGVDRQKFVRQTLADEDKNALEVLLKSHEGRWFIARLMKNEGLTTTAFTGNSATFYNEGRRAVVVEIYQTIKRLLGVEGIKQLHEAQEELMEFEEKALEMAEQREVNNG